MQSRKTTKNFDKLYFWPKLQLDNWEMLTNWNKIGKFVNFSIFVIRLEKRTKKRSKELIEKLIFSYKNRTTHTKRVTFYIS